MELEQAIEICENFAKKKDTLEFSRKGTCGFGRTCVGIRDTVHNVWVDFNPIRHDNYEMIKGLSYTFFPVTENAYHKHDCLAVLADTEEQEDLNRAIVELARWLEKIEALGEVEIVEYENHADGVQALFLGKIGLAVKIKEKNEQTNKHTTENTMGS